VLLNLLQIVERPGEVVFPWPSFGLYASICTALGLRSVRVPLDGAALDPQAMLGAVGPETRAVVLCNPNNPTGTYMTLGEVRALADELPEGCLLILDEAYGEFVSDEAFHGSHELALNRTNVVVARTFSKAHGLAGLRVGYGIAPRAVADYFERVRFPFSVNLAAQAAAAASMRAHARIRERAEFVAAERERMQAAFAGAGLEYVRSQANFVLVRAEPGLFESNGVLVREGEALGWEPGWSRVTVGNRAENDLVIGALEHLDVVGA
jgi:histidinol-phosphate aminotransferase